MLIYAAKAIKKTEALSFNEALARLLDHNFTKEQHFSILYHPLYKTVADHKNVPTCLFFS